MRSTAGLLACLLTLAAPASRAASAGDDRWLRHAQTLLPAADGLYSLGGATLQVRAPGASRWRTLWTVPHDNLYRVAADGAGRVLAAWERDPNLHLFADGRHRAVPKPAPADPPARGTPFQVESLAFAPDGPAAIVWLAASGGDGRRVTVAWRVPLDGSAGARELLRVDGALPLRLGAADAVFAFDRDPARPCTLRDCRFGTVAGYALSPTGATRADLWTPAAGELAGVSIVRGGAADEAALLLTLAAPSRRLLGRWHPGAAQLDISAVTAPALWAGRALLTRAGELVEVGRHGEEDETLVLRRGRPGEAGELVELPARHGIDEGEDGLYGLGERPDGSLWLHWGDHLILWAHGAAPRQADVGKLLPRGTEWAGADPYLATPESLWLGVDGVGRDFVRVTFAEAEREAGPWPAAAE